MGFDSQRAVLCLGDGVSFCFRQDFGVKRFKFPTGFGLESFRDFGRFGWWML